MEALGNPVVLPDRGESGDQFWVHVLPVGSFTGLDGRGPYHVRDLDKIVQASREQSDRRKMVIDYNHGTDLAANKGKDAPAAGWIVGLKVQQDGVWALVEWTGKAARHIADREYRYISPVISHDRQGNVSHIVRASLVNAPNFDQLTALASAETTAMTDSLFAARLKRLALDLKTRPATAEERKEIAKIADAVAELEKRAEDQSAHAADPSQYVPIGQFERAVQEVKRLNQGISLQAAETHVGDQIDRGNLLPWMKDWAVGLCTSNKPALDTFISRTSPQLRTLLTPMSQLADPPNSATSIHAAGPSLSQDELEVCNRMGIAPEDYRNTKGAANGRPE